jgi:uncharacterized protein YdhG (YjbR/CyaY superfamily)
MKRTTPKTIDQYLAGLSAEQRAALQRLRRAIRAAAPGAEECISYRIPAFRYEGRMLVWFGASKNHCSFYPGGVVAGLKNALKGYETSKGTIRFQPDHPLPDGLVRRIVKTRIAYTRGLRSGQ